jgi:hypothetical protein
MRTLMLAAITAGLSWLLLGPPAMAREDVPGIALQARTVTVYDYSGDGWTPHVAGMVSAYNAVMARPFPWLSYRRMTPTSCRDVKQRKNSLTVCITDAVLRNAGGGIRWSPDAPHIGTHSMFVVQGDAPPVEWDATYLQNVVCHEMMHALTGIQDNYWIDDAGVVHWRTGPEDSCVWGHNTTPGSWDVAYAQRVYQKYGPSERRDERRHKHRHH